MEPLAVIPLNRREANSPCAGRGKTFDMQDAFAPAGVDVPKGGKAAAGLPPCNRDAGGDDASAFALTFAVSPKN